MRLHRLHARQGLSTTLDEAWAFFATPANLPLITPEWLQFSLSAELPLEMHVGQAIGYTIRPFPGLRMAWLTVITAVDAPHSFVDEQRVGPYAVWHHRHEFREVEGGVEASDTVHYGLPLDPLSRPVHDLVVRRQIEAIFAYRYRALADRFGTLDGHRDPPPGSVVFSVV